MVTISELGRAWGVSHQYTSKLAKKGMPLDSKESADLWREAYASSKAPSNPMRVARTVDEENDDGSLLPQNLGNAALKTSRMGPSRHLRVRLKILSSMLSGLPWKLGDFCERQ